MSANEDTLRPADHDVLSTSADKARFGLSSMVREAKLRTEQAHDVFLLLDCSGSMSEYVEPGRSKIAALRDIVGGLRDEMGFTQVIFGSDTLISATIPYPSGGTPLHDAIHLSRTKGAKKLIVVSDGCPDDKDAALSEARAFGGPIDVFYVGPVPHEGEDFLRQLSEATKGQFRQASMSAKKSSELRSAIRMAICEKSEVPK